VNTVRTENRMVNFQDDEQSVDDELDKYLDDLIPY